MSGACFTRMHQLRRKTFDKFLIYTYMQVGFIWHASSILLFFIVVEYVYTHTIYTINVLFKLNMHVYIYIMPTKWCYSYSYIIGSLCKVCVRVYTVYLSIYYVYIFLYTSIYRDKRKKVDSSFFFYIKKRRMNQNRKYLKCGFSLKYFDTITTIFIINNFSNRSNKER